jgi:hypothetical protein
MNVFWSTYIEQRLVRLQRLEARARCCYGARIDTGLARSPVVDSPYVPNELYLQTYMLSLYFILFLTLKYGSYDSLHADVAVVKLNSKSIIRCRSRARVQRTSKSWSAGCCEHKLRVRSEAPFFSRSGGEFCDIAIGQ